MEKLIRVSMMIDGRGETITVGSLYDAGAQAASFIRHLNLDEHVDAEVRIEVEISELATSGSVEF